MNRIARGLALVALLLTTAGLSTSRATLPLSATDLRQHYPYVQNPYETGYAEAQSWRQGRTPEDIDYERQLAMRLRDEIDGSQPNALNQYYYMSGYIDGLGEF